MLGLLHVLHVCLKISEFSEATLLGSTSSHSCRWLPSEFCLIQGSIALAAKQKFVSVVNLGKNNMPASTDYKPVHCASSSSPTRPSQISEKDTWHQCQCGSPSCSSNQSAHRQCSIFQLSLSCLLWTISFIITHLNQIAQQPRNQLTNHWCHRWNHAYA